MKNNHLLSIIMIAYIFAGCASTKETPGVWVNREKIQGKAYSNLFIIVMTADIEARVRLENDLAAIATSRGFKTVKSYEVLPADLKDPKPPAVDDLVAKIKASDCDAVFLASLLDQKEAVDFTAGGTSYTMRSDYSWSGTFFGYYSHYYSTVSTPGYYTSSKTYVMQSNLFDRASQEKMFSVQSDIFNPSSLASFSRTYTSTLMKQLDKAKVLKK